MTFARSQKGLSVLSWLAVLAVVAFFASTAFKMLPHYLDYMSMEKMITSVGTDQGLEIKTVGDFYSHVDKGMQVNSIRDLDLREVLQIKVENNQFVAHLKYEKREPLIENLDLVARFDKEYRVRMP
jgi:phosphorylcholine metabolism protein LicD